MIRRVAGAPRVAVVVAVVVTGVMALAGCGPTDTGEGGSSRDGRPGAGPEVDSPVGEADTLGDGASSSDAAVCLEGGPFVARGEIEVAGGAAGVGAGRVGGLRWHRYDGCERFVIDLVAGAGAGSAGAGAGAGTVTAEVLRDLGVVRVTLRDVEGSEPEATDASFAGPLARAAYVVASPEGGWVYVDLHLGGAAEAAVVSLTDPARVVVDLRPGGGPVPAAAPSENRVVVLTPRPGPATYPLTVRGYARTFESNVVVRLEREGQDVFKDFTTATAWADAWGHYSLTIPDGPAARVVLHVGEHSARDGTWEGVAIPLEMR